MVEHLLLAVQVYYRGSSSCAQFQGDLRVGYFLREVLIEGDCGEKIGPLWKICFRNPDEDRAYINGLMHAASFAAELSSSLVNGLRKSS